MFARGLCSSGIKTRRRHRRTRRDACDVLTVVVMMISGWEDGECVCVCVFGGMGERVVLGAVYA